MKPYREHIPVMATFSPKQFEVCDYDNDIWPCAMVEVYNEGWNDAARQIAVDISEMSGPSVCQRTRNEAVRHAMDLVEDAEAGEK